MFYLCQHTYIPQIDINLQNIGFDPNLIKKRRASFLFYPKENHGIALILKMVILHTKIPIF